LSSSVGPPSRAPGEPSTEEINLQKQGCIRDQVEISSNGRQWQLGKR
jgi:hypothetical protein